ncbi:MAG: type III-A CRISPR-associated protein Csm2 [Acidobacteriota bacterium]|nr:type III-A CRISPR-associated protein Csm2 [Acidobacteriota bacterium]
MPDDVQPEVTTTPATEAEATPAPEAAPAPEVTAPAQAAEPAASEAPKPKPEARPQGPRPQGQQKREDRPPRPDNRSENRLDNRGGGGQHREGRGDRPPGDRQPQGDRRPGGDRREGGRPGGGRPFEMAPEIELEKLISDSLYLDNQAHAVVARMRDMDSGTKSQLRRLYNAVRRAVRAPEAERQHHFVMLRARLAYTIARHSLRSLDALERLLLQVTRRNDARGYERFKDLFEAIVAYNE